MQHDDQRWLKLADRISHGQSIDWDAEASNDETDDSLAIVRSLNIIAAVAQVHTGERRLDMPELAAAPMSAGPAANGRESGGFLSLKPGDRWSKLEIRDELGRGSYGVVLRAHDPALQRDVALKLQHFTRGAEDAQRMLDEGRRLARLRHENVVQIFGAKERDGDVGLWMELIEGRTLSEVVAAQGVFGEHEALHIGTTLCRALAAVHGAGVLHRDIKAQNVMREEGGRLLLMDLGAGLERSQARHDAGNVRGTPLYLAPELLEGSAPSVASDIYAMGVLLYHILSGGFPIVAGGFEELQSMHRAGTRRSLADARPDLSPAFVNAIDTALSPRPGDRYESAGAMAQAFAALSASGSRSISREDHPTGVEPSLRSPVRWVLPLAAAALLVLVVFGMGQRQGWFAGGYELEARWYRTGESSREELFPGATVHPGETLSLAVEASEPLHVYVLGQDDTGQRVVLFPVVGNEPQNPLPPDVEHQLPGRRDGELMDWALDASVGRERFIVVAAREALPELESLLADVPRLADQHGLTGPVYPPLDAAANAGLRGVAGLQRRRAAPGANDDDLFERVAELADGGQRADGVYMRRIEFRKE